MDLGRAMDSQIRAGLTLVRYMNRFENMVADNSETSAASGLIKLEKVPLENGFDVGYDFPYAGPIAKFFLARYLYKSSDFVMPAELASGADLDLDVSVLSLFCIEGDNLEHAKLLCSGLMSYLAMHTIGDDTDVQNRLAKLKLAQASSQQKPIQWRCPISWDALFGPPISDDAPLY